MLNKDWNTTMQLSNVMEFRFHICAKSKQYKRMRMCASQGMGKAC